ncbi:Dachshund 1 [Clonorchis sinensis]|uniref:Dachshund 1 n=1 Tax=Clonorchis sinensis TaxID=79923 RepID=A0A8T1M141_CLOSI|nr:Dachshund 1 [Clonorchis sinensis]
MNFPVQLPRSDHQFTQPIVCDHLSIGYSQPENTIMDVTCYSQVDEKRPVVMDLSTRRDYSGIPNNCPAVKTIPYQLPLRAGPATKPLAYCTPNPVPNVPENNQVHLLEYRGAQLAAFTVEGRDLVCLPQAFELFLKHLVGGLHTVYTKLKRLEIVPVVCNVEQVRILRGLGAIQPGVNRCKLIAPQEFDILYADCTSSR